VYFRIVQHQGWKVLKQNLQSHHVAAPHRLFQRPGLRRQGAHRLQANAAQAAVDAGAVEAGLGVHGQDLEEQRVGQVQKSGLKLRIGLICVAVGVVGCGE
jgi:hypothetical protein